MPKSTSTSSKKPSQKAKSTQKKKAKNNKKNPKRSNPKHQMPSFVFRTFKPSRRIGSGGVMPKSKALGRLIRWPKYVKLQRQRKILLQRLKIPPALNIFNQAAPKTLATDLIKLFSNYKTETRSQKRDRKRKQANNQEQGKVQDSQKPILVKMGFNHVTNLIERGQAKLVLIAHDVDPIELVLWMPTLCVKKKVPFAIIKGKSRLGTIVNKKTASCLALCEVRSKDQEQFDKLCQEANVRFNKRFNQMKKKWSGRTLGVKTMHKIGKRQRARKKEAERRKEAQQRSREAANKVNKPKRN
jgi:large subunit ribosomal protein L7Ae